MTIRKTVVAAGLSYVILSVISFAYFIVMGLDVLGDSPVPVPARLVALPLLVLASPFWYLTDVFQVGGSFGGAIARVLGAVVSIAVAAFGGYKAAVWFERRSAKR